jgi:putative transposase
LPTAFQKEFLNFLSDDLKNMKVQSESERDREKYSRIQSHLDTGFGSCILRESESAKIVQDALLFLDIKKFDLREWVIMPNHVHFLARFEEGKLMSKALHSLKSYTAHELKKLHPEMESIWQAESFDRYIRNEEHFLRTVRYIHENPVNAKLCPRAKEFQWSSAFARSE